MAVERKLTRREVYIDKILKSTNVEEVKDALGAERAKQVLLYPIATTFGLASAYHILIGHIGKAFVTQGGPISDISREIGAFASHGVGGAFSHIGGRLSEIGQNFMSGGNLDLVLALSLGICVGTSIIIHKKRRDKNLMKERIAELDGGSNDDEPLVEEDDLDVDLDDDDDLNLDFERMPESTHDVTSTPEPVVTPDHPSVDARDIEFAERMSVLERSHAEELMAAEAKRVRDVATAKEEASRGKISISEHEAQMGPLRAELIEKTTKNAELSADVFKLGEIVKNSISKATHRTQLSREKEKGRKEGYEQAANEIETNNISLPRLRQIIYNLTKNFYDRGVEEGQKIQSVENPDIGERGAR